MTDGPAGVAPHLQAGTLDDLAFAQGRESATCRAWQVEVARRRAEGRLAALLGPAGLPWDVFATRVLLARTARTAYDALLAETRSFVSSYVDGVNAALAHGVSAPELDRRGVVPEPWEPWTPVGIFLATHVLFAQFPDKLWRRLVEQRAGADVLAALLTSPGPIGGSNALALTGERTGSGLPLITGDPHRTFEAPNGYAQVRLSTPDLDVVGFAFPGVPGVPHFAQARSAAGGVAWAITNAMADYQDLYVETLRRGDGGVEALGPDGWWPCRTATATVEVAGADPVTVPIVETERGPVLHDAEGETLSLRTASYVLGACGLDAVPTLLRARTVADVEAAFEHWVEPVNNLLAADSTGAVVHRVVGRVPLRARSRVPVPADDPAYLWRGWVDLPAVAPVDGAVVTANDRVNDDWGRVGSDFAAPYRAARIRERLGERERWSAEDVHEVLMDVRQNQGAVLLDLLPGLTGLSLAGLALRDELVGWDREMRAESSTAASYVAVREALVDAICALPLLDGVRDAAPYGELVGPWFDLPTRVTSGLHTFVASAAGLGVDLPDLLRAAVETAARAERRTWGSRHVFAPLTPSAYVGLGDADALGDPDSWLDVAGVPLDGDSSCVRVTGTIPGRDVVLRGSVARYVWDLADPGASRWAVPLGVGAHDTSQFEAWRTGRLVRVVR